MIAIHQVNDKIVEYFKSLKNGSFAYKKDAITFCGLNALPKSSNLRREFNKRWRFFTTKRNGAFLVKHTEIKNAWFFFD
jgi:hypothetical protein